MNWRITARDIATLLGTSDLAISARRENRYASSSPSEIVLCAVDGDRELHLFCKYAHARASLGLWGGVEYEAAVHARALRRLGVSVPRLYGTCRSPEHNCLCAVFEYVEGLRMKVDVSYMRSAARWLGEFHTRAEALGDLPELPLIRYDAPFYRGWSSRTLLYARHYPQPLPWLAAFCERFDAHAPCLALPPFHLVHGEFFPSNVLVRDGRVYPVDWETAALAASEIDLACLTQGWGPEIGGQLERDYQDARGRRICAERLDLARAFLLLRWLGSEPSAPLHPRSPVRFAELRALGEKWGVC